MVTKRDDPALLDAGPGSELFSAGGEKSGLQVHQPPIDHNRDAVQITEPRPRMTLEAFKPVVKGSLRGFAAVKLPNGLRIDDVTVCTSHGRAWANFPSKPILIEGRHAVDERGKKRYEPFLSWPDRDTTNRWSDAVVALVRQQHPDVLDAGGEP